MPCRDGYDAAYLPTGRYQEPMDTKAVSVIIIITRKENSSTRIKCLYLRLEKANMHAVP